MINTFIKQSLVGLLLTFGFASLIGTGVAIAQETDETEHEERAQEHRAHHKKMREKFHDRRAKHREERLIKLDTDEDGRVDLNEFLANAEQRFHSMDLNQDLYVTEEEAREAHMQIRKMHRKKYKEMRKNRQKPDQE